MAMGNCKVMDETERIDGESSSHLDKLLERDGDEDAADYR
jgi:hypothetical protein